ncbi:MAG: L-seryl-tRNA(Sec) selenium transferase, partial [Phycisphaerae bacterium]
MTKTTKTLLRSLPSVDAMLELNDVQEWLQGLPRASVVEAVQAAIDGARDAILDGRLTDPVDLGELVGLAEHVLTQRAIPSLRRVINATGILLQTGLGRAPM